MATIRSSLAYSIADSYLSLPLQLIGTMIISRLLTPAETGIFAVAAVFAAFASTFRDFGVAEYLIQEKELRSDHIRAALTVNIGISWTMSLLLFFCAPKVAEFYRSTGVAEVMQVQAFNFLLIPFGAVTMAYFRRQLDFRPIFICNLSANLTTFTVSTVCALNGFGYMSLAWSSLSGVVVTVATSVWLRPKEFPKWPGTEGIRRVLHFGKFASGIYLFGQIGRGAPEMIIGRVQDMSGVAMFSRGGGLVELFNRTVMRAILPVCLPYFAKSNREQGSVVSGYLNSMSYLTAIGWPFLAFTGILAYSAIRIIYGVQWIASVPLAQVLCLAGAIELIHYLAKEALIAVQEVKRSNSLQLGIQSARIFGLFAVIPYGLTGASYGLLVAAMFSMGLSQWHLHKAIGLHAKDVVKACVPSLITTAAIFLPLLVWVSIEPVSELNYFTFAFVGGAGTLLVWIFVLRIMKHPLWTEILTMVNRLAQKVGLSKKYK